MSDTKENILMTALRLFAQDGYEAVAIAQYSFWTADEFASNFRRMLTLEQYRNREMNKLYQNY